MTGKFYGNVFHQILKVFLFPVKHPPVFLWFSPISQTEFSISVKNSDHVLIIAATFRLYRVREQFCHMFRETFRTKLKFETDGFRVISVMKSVTSCGYNVYHAHWAEDFSEK